MDMLLSDSDGDSSDEDEDVITDHAAMAVTFHETHPKQTGYLNVISTYSDADFWRHFRVTRSTFEFILKFLNDNRFRDQVTYHGGCETVKNSEMVLIVLQYLGNQGAIRLLADKFNRTESKVWSSAALVCNFLIEKQSKFIMWPKPSEMARIQRRFKSKRGFPGVIS